MFFNYPFWFTFFTKLNYEVVLSPTSTRNTHELGIESIPSESECYPAKMVHGHVTWLLKKGIKFIFYPCIPYERNEFPDAVNHYNCPIVTSYAENIKNNVDELHDQDIDFRNPFLAFTSEAVLTDRLVQVFPELPVKEVREAAHAAWEELSAARSDIEKKVKKLLPILRKQDAGELSLQAVLTMSIRKPPRDSLIPAQQLRAVSPYRRFYLSSGKDRTAYPRGVNDQWMYHSRLYAAASFVKTRDDLDLIQLNSFGCGLDAVTTDEVYEILDGSGKIYTCLKNSTK